MSNKKENPQAEALDFAQRMCRAILDLKSSSSYFILQQAYGDLSWEELEEKMEAILMATYEKFETPQGSGVYLIAMERQRQMDVEHWSPAHDAQHIDESIACAAACYAMPEHTRRQYQSLHVKYGWYPRWWPASWDLSWWKPTPQDRIRELTKAGALCAAEIDRIKNQEAYEKSTP